LNVQALMLKKKIQGMENLPTLSASVTHILRLLGDENVNASKLHEALNRDPSICADMLKVTNSALFGLRQRVTSVEQATALLGLRAVRNIVWSASVVSVISGREKDVWLHSYSCAMLMHSVIRSSNLQVADDMEVTALIHDIGRIVVMDFSELSNRVINDVAQRDLLPIHLAERQVLSASHDTIADWLLELWNMSPSVRIPVSLHHQETIPDQYLLETALLQLVDYVDLRARGVPASPPPPPLLEAAGIDRAIIPELVAYQEAQVAQVDGNSFLAGTADAHGSRPPSLAVRAPQRR